MCFHFFRLDFRKQASNQAGRQAREPGSVRKGVFPPGKLENGKKVSKNGKLGGGLKYFLIFTAIWGNDPI